MGQIWSKQLTVADKNMYKSISAKMRDEPIPGVNLYSNEGI